MRRSSSVTLTPNPPPSWMSTKPLAKRVSLLRKHRKPAASDPGHVSLTAGSISPNTARTPQTLSSLSQPQAGSSRSAAMGRSSSIASSTDSNGSSILFAHDVNYDSDDGREDYFERRLVRDLERAIATPPQNIKAYAAWSSSPELSSSACEHDDYFSAPSSPAMASTWRPPCDSAAIASSLSRRTSSAADTQPDSLEAKKPAKLRKGNRSKASLPTPATHLASPAEASPPPAEKPLGLLGRLKTMRRRASLASQPSQEPRKSVGVRMQERLPPLQTTPHEIVTAVDAHNALYYPSQYPPVTMPPSFAQAMQRSNSYYYASEPGHTSAWPSEPGHTFVWDTSSNDHNTELTPATSEEAQQFFQKPSPSVPPIPQLPMALQHLRKEPPPPPRRKPVPQMHLEDDPEVFIEQKASDATFPMIPEAASERADESVRTTPDTTPDLLSDDSSGTSGDRQLLEMVPRSVSAAAGRVDSSPERVASSSRPPLLRRPQLLRREPSRRWSTTASGSDARLRAALCAQEIVQTEENYRQALGQLLRGETTTTPPKPLLALIPALLVASPRFQSPPQAGALAKTFLEGVHSLECALLDWCYLAGAYFNPYGRSQSTSALSSPRMAAASPVPAMSRGRRLSMAWDQLWDPAFTSAISNDFKLVRDIPSSPISPTSKAIGETPRRRTLVSERSRRHSRALLFERLGLDSARSSPSVASSENSQTATTAPKPTKKPTVADLAIQPTQRAVRYVLLFRELLAHTMQDDLHGDGPRVQEALEEALRLAKACDAALAVSS